MYGAGKATIQIWRQEEFEEQARRAQPWQQQMTDCPFMLHTPLAVPVDGAAIRADYLALAAHIQDFNAYSTAEDGSWSVLTLVDRPQSGQAGTPTPALAAMPSVAALLARTGWTVVAAHLMRLPPWGVLPWHYEMQTPYADGSRALLPVIAPQGAVTLLGAASTSYPEGGLWVGDFNFPHQVENRSDHDRVILIVDVVNNAAFQADVPPEMRAHVPERLALAQAMNNLLLSWRAEAA